MEFNRKIDSPRKKLLKILIYFSLFFFAFYVIYTFKFTCSSSQIYTQNNINIVNPKSSSKSEETLEDDYDYCQNPPQNPQEKSPTELHHIVFGLASSADLWDQRQKYIKLWWRPQMRGYVWLNKPIKNDVLHNSSSLPPIKISSDTSKFEYKNKIGDRSALRISRIVSETVRLGLKDVRWVVMGDDDTFFVVDNLIRVLRKYDHEQFYYIGTNSESHVQNIVDFSYKMAYGGGGFAISYPLAKALEKIQDQCMERYPELYGSDDRIHACMAELGIPLTKEVGFHQFDLFGSVLGLLAAHPVTPIVSLHHLDVIQPIFPKMGRVEALEKLKVPIELDSAGLMQQSICYDKNLNWTVSVSWGYAVQIIRAIVPARVMEVPTRTFINWYKNLDPKGFSFNTRPIPRGACEQPIVFLFNNASYDPSVDRTASEYVQQLRNRRCRSRLIYDPAEIHSVEVYKKPDPNVWSEAPRRDCCRVLPSIKKDSMAVEVGKCREDEFFEF